MAELRNREPVSGQEGVSAFVHFATPSDHAECKRLHRRYGTTYFFATQRFPRRFRRRVHALYGFVRVADEWVDNGTYTSGPEREATLNDYRNQLIRGMDGVSPTHPVLRAFCDVAHENSLSMDEPLRFLDAMQMDIRIRRYLTYEDLKVYMRGSAAAVGLMMCEFLEVESNEAIRAAAIALGEAMQLTNFLRDVGEDSDRGRIYLPIEDLERFPGSEKAILSGEVTRPFVRLMKFEIERARELYAASDAGIPMLPSRVRQAVKLARILYARILDRIEERGYDVFSGRARTTRVEKVATAFRVLTGVV